MLVKVEERHRCLLQKSKRSISSFGKVLRLNIFSPLEAGRYACSVAICEYWDYRTNPLDM